MTTLICGSLAYDTIMVFPDRFKNYILPDQIHILNVCFVNPEMRREYGGCAGNIAYSLKLLGGDPLPMGTVGSDFQLYRQRVQELEIPDHHLAELEGLFTAQCVITTDLDNNQITVFHPGAMDQAHKNRVADAEGVALGIVAPDGREAMLQHAADFAELGVPFIMDPGQNLPLFNKQELLGFVDQATWLVMNDYESQLLMDRVESPLEALVDQLEAIVVTRGAEGSRIYTNGSVLEIPAVHVEEPVDPTGCGDAFRAGMLYGLARGWQWEVTGRIASLLGAYKVAYHGTQNHHFSREAFAKRYLESFGEALPTDWQGD